MKTDDEILLKSWQRAMIYTIVWIAVTVGLYIISDIVIQSILLHIAFVMILLPITTLAVTFGYTRRCGLKPWLIAMLAAAAVIMYFFFGFKELSPDFLLTNIICGFFGFGVGNVMKNEALVAAQEDFDNTKKKLEQAKEKAYISLVDADPKTGKRSNLRKKNQKSKDNK